MVIGSTRKILVVTIEDESGVVVDLRGGSAKLQGHSGDLPAADLDVEGTLSGSGADLQNGIVVWPRLGDPSIFVDDADLTAAGITSALYRCRIQYTDAGTLVDYGPEFDLVWVMPPVASA